MSALARQYAEALSPHDGDAQWLADLKTRGAEEFRSNGLPDKRVEQWKYTSLYSLEQQQPALGYAGIDAQAFETTPPLAGLALRVSMIDGGLAAVDGETVAGLTVQDLSAALQNAGAGLQAMLAGLAFDGPGQGFSALNTATLGNGLVVHVEKGVKAGPLLLQWNSTPAQQGVLVNSRVVIVLEEGAALDLVEQHETPGSGGSILNVVVQGKLAGNAEFTLTRVQQQSASSFLFTRTDIEQSNNSLFHFTGLDLGDGLARHDVRSDLIEPGAVCALNAACMTRGVSHVDHHLEANHVAPGCKSSQLFRAVANDRSRVVFNGKVHVHKGADGTDAKQSSAGLLLSKMAEIDAKPELEIYADEVIASHGATVGQLDEKALFYLRSRGVSRSEARNMLTMAFCRSVTDQLAVASLREPLGERLTRSLANNG